MSKQQVSNTADRRIVVLDNGWCFIGIWFPASEGRPAYLDDASCIRRWGTTGGLGQIALTGPTAETILDACGIVIIENPAAVIYHLKCVYTQE